MVQTSVSPSQKTFSTSNVIESPYLTTRQAAEYLGFAPLALAVGRMNPVPPLRLGLTGPRGRSRIADLENFVNNRANHHRKTVSPTVGRPPGKSRKGNRKAAR